MYILAAIEPGFLARAMKTLGIVIDYDITIGIQMGNVTFSFNTDQKGSNVKTKMKAIREIALAHASLFKSLRSKIDVKAVATREFSPQVQPRRKGKGETTMILNQLEDGLIPNDYFKTARTTGDVKAELERQTSVPFTSRKVSQALGVLFNQKVLARVGSKGNFRYIHQ